MSGKNIAVRVSDSFWSNTCAISSRSRQKGLQYAVEGYIKNIKINKEGDTTTVEAKAYRSMAKSEKPHDLYLTCNEHSLLDQLCSCTAGSPGFCSHIVGLMYTLDLCRARHNDISSTSQPQQWHKARGKKITGQPVSSVVVAKAKVNRKRKPIMSSYIHNKKELGTAVYGLLREMSDAPISYIADETAPEVEVGGRKYAVGCGLSHQERRSVQRSALKPALDPPKSVTCKVVVVGDSQSGKTALLHVFAKDCFPESYVPTVFENYTASFEIDMQRIELSLWDTSGSPYYDNVRPLSYKDSDAVLVCFDISRPETLDSVLKKWKAEIQEFCPSTKVLLVGCKSDLRTDLSTLVELSNQRRNPVSYDQASSMAKQISAVYIECSAQQSENSVRDIFHVATLACVNKTAKEGKRAKSPQPPQRASHMPSQPKLPADTAELRKDKAKSCSVM